MSPAAKRSAKQAPKRTTRRATPRATKPAARPTAKPAGRPPAQAAAKRATAKPKAASRARKAAPQAPRPTRSRSSVPRRPVSPPPASPPPAAPFTVFLDRDGVLNENPRIQVRRWDGFHWLPGAREALARLNRPDAQVCIVTNQPATGLGYSTPRMIHHLHAQMLEEVRAAGGRIDRIEICFAPPLWPARRRKPRPGMVEDAAAAFEVGPGFDAARAILVGDKVKDAQAAAAFGIPAILVATTYDAARLQRDAGRAGVPYLAIADGLPEAVDLILGFVAEAQP